MTTRERESLSAAPADASLTIDGGVCLMMFAYDVGLAIDLDRAEREIVATKQRETIRPKRKTPPYFQYEPAPIRVTQTCEPLVVAGHASAPTVDAVLYDFGAISVTYRFPLESSLERLLALSEELYDNRALLDHSRSIVQVLMDAVRPAITRPSLANLVEDYAIYQIEAVTPAGPVEELLRRHAEVLAQVLRSERVALSPQEIEEALRCRHSFGPEDAVILDWNAALVFDREADDTRMVLEYANVELLEMRYLDDQLDGALDRAYQTLSHQKWWPLLLLDRSHADLRRIAELQMDNALLFEGVNNALKLLGDQYLARVYRLAAQRLHLSDWDGSILRKLGTLESIYEKVSGLVAHRRAEFLEWIIIALIAIEIVLTLVRW